MVTGLYEGVEEPVPDTDAPSSAGVRATSLNGTAAKRIPGQVLREARARDSETKRARVLATLDAMAATGEKITFSRLARTARVSTWLVYAEGMREHIDEAIKKQGGTPRHESEVDSRTSAESLATDLELAKAELRTLRAERDRLKAGVRLEASKDLIAHIQALTAANQTIATERDTLAARLREAEAERDRLREVLKESEERMESALKENGELCEQVNQSGSPTSMRAEEIHHGPGPAGISRYNSAPQARIETPHEEVIRNPERSK